MNTYYNIASNSESEALTLVQEYGYAPSSTDELADALQQIVAANGEDGLRTVMSLHPDKTVILELFAGYPKNSPQGKFAKNMQSIKRGFAADGSTSTMQPTNKANSNTLVNQTSAMILAAAVIMSVAILVSNK